VRRCNVNVLAHPLGKGSRRGGRVRGSRHSSAVLSCTCASAPWQPGPGLSVAPPIRTTHSPHPSLSCQHGRVCRARVCRGPAIGVKPEARGRRARVREWGSYWATLKQPSILLNFPHLGQVIHPRHHALQHHQPLQQPKVRSPSQGSLPKRQYNHYYTLTHGRPNNSLAPSVRVGSHPPSPRETPR
jgi:hypothetical protein